MTRRVTTVIVAAGLALGVAQAAAQPAARGTALGGYVAVDGGVQATSTRATSTVQYKLYGEDIVMHVTYVTDAAPVFGARAGARVWRRLTLGAGITRFTNAAGASVKAELPHPFFFQRLRSVEGTADAIARQEFVAYAEVGWLFTVQPKIDVLMFAGPAFFHTRQDVATRLVYAESYPFDTASFLGVESSEMKKTTAGFSVGADLTYRVTPHVGVGGLLRFSRATLTADALQGQPVTLDLGGLQMNLGVRFRF